MAALTERWSHRIPQLLQGISIALRGAFAAAAPTFAHGNFKTFVTSWLAVVAAIYVGLGVIGLTVGAPVSLFLALFWPGAVLSALTYVPQIAFELVNYRDPALLASLFASQAETALPPSLAKRLRSSWRKSQGVEPRDRLLRRVSRWKRLARGSVISTGLSILPFSTPLVLVSQWFSNAWALGSTVLEPYFQSEHLSNAEREAVITQRRWLITGFGLPFAVASSIPFLGAFAHPLAQAAAAYLVPLIEPQRGKRGEGSDVHEEAAAAAQAGGQPTGEKWKAGGEGEGETTRRRGAEAGPALSSALQNLPSTEQLQENLWGWVDSALDVVINYVARLPHTPYVGPLYNAAAPVLLPVLRYVWNTFIPEEQAVAIPRMIEEHLHRERGGEEWTGGGGRPRSPHKAAGGGAKHRPQKPRAGSSEQEAHPHPQRASAATSGAAHTGRKPKKAASPKAAMAPLPPSPPARVDTLQQSRPQAQGQLPEQRGMEYIPPTLGETLMRPSKDAEQAGAAPPAGASGMASESPSSRMSATSSRVQVREPDTKREASPPRFISEHGGMSIEEASKQPDVPAAGLASSAGGGGHSYAAVAAAEPAKTEDAPQRGLMRARHTGAQAAGEGSAQEVQEVNPPASLGKQPVAEPSASSTAPGRMEAAMAPGLQRASLGTDSTQSH